MAELPPDLERLGNALTDAASRAVAARRRRAHLGRRLAACVAAGVLVFAAMTPSHLGTAEFSANGLIELASIAGADGQLGGGCDRPHGAGGRYFQVPTGCVIARPQPQAR